MTTLLDFPSSVPGSKNLPMSLPTENENKDKKNVLLVEPIKDRKYPSMALMKLSEMHKKKGNNIHFVRGYQYFLPFNPDIIHITSLFSWDFQEVANVTASYKNVFPNAEVQVGGVMATLLAKDFEEATGTAPHQGILPEAEHCKLDYTIYPELEYSIAYTSRSCIRKCAWCYLGLGHEGRYQEIQNWRELYVNPRLERILFHDNNFLACSDKHFNKTVADLRRLGKTVDFNQGLDARLLTTEKAKKLRRVRINPIRFAFDSIDIDGDIQKGIKTARENRMKGEISIYMLFNFNEKPDEIWYRMNELNKLKVSIFPMCFQPLKGKYAKIKSGERNGQVFQGFVGKHWNPDLLRGFRLIIREEFIGGSIGSGLTRDKFQDVFGASGDTFEDILMDYKRRHDKLIEDDKEQTRIEGTT